MPSEIVAIDLEDSPIVVQDVMELAADVQNFKFTVTYCGKDTGYTIDRLSGLANAEDCQWLLFYRAPNDDELVFQRNAEISKFVVAPNSTVTLSYEPEPSVPPAPSPTPSPSPSPDGARPSFGILNSLAVVVFVLVGAVMVH